MGGQPHAPAASTPGKDPVVNVQEVGWAPWPVWTGGKSRTHRDSIPDRPARSQSLYRLSYPAHGKNTAFSILWLENMSSFQFYDWKTIFSVLWLEKCWGFSFMTGKLIFWFYDRTKCWVFRFMTGKLIFQYYDRKNAEFSVLWLEKLRIFSSVCTCCHMSNYFELNAK